MEHRPTDAAHTRNVQSVRVQEEDTHTHTHTHDMSAPSSVSHPHTSLACQVERCSVDVISTKVVSCAFFGVSDPCFVLVLLSCVSVVSKNETTWNWPEPLIAQTQREQQNKNARVVCFCLVYTIERPPSSSSRVCVQHARVYSVCIETILSFSVCACVCVLVCVRVLASRFAVSDPPRACNGSDVSFSVSQPPPTHTHTTFYTSNPKPTPLQIDFTL